MTFVMKTFLILAVSARSSSSGITSHSSGTTSRSSDSGFHSDPESGDSSDNDMGADKITIAWSCLANVCRSAGAHIFSEVIAKCIKKYKHIKFDIRSFGGDGKGKYGRPASPTLKVALFKYKKEYLKLAKEKMKIVKLTQDEENCWNREIDTITESFRSTAPTTEVLCKNDMTVYAAANDVKKFIKNTEAYQKCGKKPEIQLMIEGGIEDEGWHASALAERLVFITLLKMYPGRYEHGQAPFNTDTGIANKEKLRIYTKREDGNPPQSSDSIPYVNNDETEITEDEIGFLWHDLATNAAGPGLKIAPEFSNLISTLGDEVGFDISGAKMKNGVYTRALYVRPGLINYHGLTEWLRGQENGLEVIGKIEDYKTSISLTAYDSLAKALIGAVSDKFNSALASSNAGHRGQTVISP